eukprot:g17050.t1
MSSAELAPLLVPVNQPEKVKSTFEEYGVCVVTNVLTGEECEELVVGLNPVFWSSAQDAGKDTNPEWLHVDQNHRTGSSSSSTVVWPKSHTEVYERMMEDPLAMLRGRSLAGQTVKLKELNQPHLREELMSEALLNARRVPCPAGSLLLWDSRTVHQGWRGGPRLAQPICWEPRRAVYTTWQRRHPALLWKMVCLC